MDIWQVVVERPGGPRFVAYEGMSEQDARAQFEAEKGGNVRFVQILFNGNLAEEPYVNPASFREEHSISEKRLNP